MRVWIIFFSLPACLYCCCCHSKTKLPHTIRTRNLINVCLLSCLYKRPKLAAGSIVIPKFIHTKLISLLDCLDRTVRFFSSRSVSADELYLSAAAVRVRLRDMDVWEEIWINKRFYRIWPVQNPKTIACIQDKIYVKFSSFIASFHCLSVCLHRACRLQMSSVWLSAARRRKEVDKLFLRI